MPRPSDAEDAGVSADLPTVLLADSEAPTRAGVRLALDGHGLTVVAEAQTTAEAVRLAVELRPAVCVLAVHIVGGGIGAAEQIRALAPETRIVMLADSDRDDDLFAALRAGADGYLLDTISPARLPHAVRGVLAGEAALPRDLTARLIREYRERGQRGRFAVSVLGRTVELTSREFEVLEGLRAGESTATMAGHLRISEVTVRRHVSTVLHKLGVPNRRAALALLADEGGSAPLRRGAA